ncbi:hypothetical protein AK830_g260 [Neonectria ditissima]|uniref:Zn(2)-C6 fungal-type domain-containing protein n=1 Tax=Neonectria ditissima TaxID=78410 RepID=A0A0N8H934_9HYPO|nr:hypothetical protein AK830_g260 [Neonectria ditissima]
MDPSNGAEDDARALDGDLGSCQGCRKRKLKCSRGLPACSHCHRLDALENALLEKQTGDGDRLRSSLDVLSNLSLELCKLINKTTASASTAIPERPANASPASLASWQHLDAADRPRKRRRLDSCGNPKLAIQLPLDDLADASSTLPPPDLLEDIVDSYFGVIQPWIPILHETRFRARMHEPKQRPTLVVVIHAMVVAAMRFVRPEVHGLTSRELEAWAKRSRSIVLLTAMDGLSVENLQALIITAFDDIGQGNASKAWSIVGSLTRTVEYLQLSVEYSDHDTQPLLKPLLSLLPSQQWVEEEERRRVFWSIFNLDRFCSVTTGWNTSLTADDVHRRLPADGGLWHKEEVVVTPYFGIWDRSAAKIGNSIAFLPATYSSPDQTSQQQPSPRPSSHAAQPDMSAVGAFAYCIEATESLSRVTTFFLQQRIDFHDRQEVSNWLTRFKELDLRLVQYASLLLHMFVTWLSRRRSWKMFLPQRWKDSNISRQPTIINMDPNLTLAHATHNTSMILLHQRIAYPPADWTNIVELPSLCSAEICRNAAIEIQNIAAKYLTNTPDMSPVGNQFAFCVFAAARVLLVHKRYYASELPRELWLLIDSLDEMAKRWLGSIRPATGQGRSLAGIYADHLRELHRRCVADANFSVDVLGYSTIVSNQTSARTQPQQQESTDLQPKIGHAGQNIPQQSAGPLLVPPRLWTTTDDINTNGNGAVNEVEVPVSAQSHSVVDDTAELVSTNTLAMGYTASQGSPNDELSAISYMLLDQSFMDMDRVISIDDMMFSINMAPGEAVPAGMQTSRGDLA